MSITLKLYKAWPDTTSRDEAAALDESMTWGESASVELLINYLFNTTSVERYYEGTDIFISDPFVLRRAGVVNFVRLQPDVTLNGSPAPVWYASVSKDNGEFWSDFVALSAPNYNIPNIAAGEDMYNCQVKFKAVLQANAAKTACAVINSIGVYAESTKVAQLTPDGCFRVSNKVVPEFINSLEGNPAPPVDEDDLNMYCLNKDAYEVYTVVEYRRPDGTLHTKSTLSGGVAPEYTTCTWEYFAENGIDVINIKVWSLTYDSNGNISSIVSV